MKNSTKLILTLLAFGEGLLAVILFRLLSGSPVLLKYLVVCAVIALAVGVDWFVMRSGSAESVSDAKKLRTADDYIRAFDAWLREDTPFTEYIKVVLRQLDSLKRKQTALRAVLDDSGDSPFFGIADEVNAYILANCRRILNRVMIYDPAEPHKYQMHASYLEEVLGENAHVLSDFENLILEVSQIGDDSNAPTPCLTELTNALRQVRRGDEPPEDWQQLPPQNNQTMQQQ